MLSKDISNIDFKSANKNKLYDGYEDERIAEKAVELIFNNKINAKNAFDVNVSFLENLPKLLNTNEESTWHRTSSSLDASVKIFGYRVDSVHSDLYKFLGGLNRATYEGETEENNQTPKKNNRIAKDKSEIHNFNEKNIENNHEKLDLKKYDLEFEYDPLFCKMTEKFNNAGVKSLILKSQPMDNNLNILLESNTGNTQYFCDVYSSIETNLSNNLQRILSCYNLDSNDIITFDPFEKLSAFIEEKGIKEESEKSLVHRLQDEHQLNNIIEKEKDKISECSIYEDQMGCNTPKDLLSTDGDIVEETKDLFTDMEIINNNILLVHNHNKEDLIDSNNIDLGVKKFQSNNTTIGEGNTTTFFKELNSKNFKNQSVLRQKKDIKTTVQKIKKEKKEEILFIFSKENCVKKDDVFFNRNYRTVKTAKIKNKKKKYTMKTPQYYHFQQEFLLKYWLDFGYYRLKGIGEENNNTEMNNDLMSCDDVTDNTKEKIFKEIDKLSKRKHDVKAIKEKIWKACEEENNKEKDFNELIGIFDDNNKDQYNFSISTYFVCLLHLANEKNLILESKDDNIVIKSDN